MQGRLTRYCVAVYILAALLLDLAYELHLALGGDRFEPIELLSTFVFFSVWLPFMPVVVRLAERFAPIRGRRLRSIEVHFFAALALSCVTLFAHKLVFCPGYCYFECLTYFRAESWMARWFALDYFVYGGVVAAIWLSLILQRMRDREAKAAAVERELASAELRLMNAQADPQSLIDLFRFIASRVNEAPEHAERMISVAADFLRLNLRAVAADDLTVADDVELLRAWVAMERERTGKNLELEIDVDPVAFDLPILTARLPRVVATAIPSKSVRVEGRHSELRLVVDGVEIAGAFS